MRRRSKTSGEPAKTRRRKTGALQAPQYAEEPCAARSSSAVCEKQRSHRLTRERDEALPAADLDRRRAQDHQPLGVQSAACSGGFD